jgi:hypothetical protein
VPLLAVAIGLVAVIALISSTGVTDSLQEFTASRTLDSSDFGSRDMTRILGLSSELHSRPNMPAPDTEFVPRDLDQAFSLDPIAPDEIADTLGVGQEWLDRGVPVVSLLMDPDDREDLESNLLGRGREWERPAYFTYIDEGQVQFATPVGVRVHGGGGRTTGRWGYRVYFRRAHGQERFPLELFPTGGELGAKRVILRQDGGPGRKGLIFHFQNAIASDIAKHIGLPYVHSQPAATYVNGEFKGVRAITERIDQHFVESHFGLENYLMARMKKMRHEEQGRVRVGPRETFMEFYSWAAYGETPTFEEVKERVDIDNLIRWILLIHIAAVADSLQGTALLDLEDPEGRWFWVPWDLGISLGIWKKPTDRPSASINRFRPYYIYPAWRRDPRAALNGRLLESSPEYRSMFSTRLDEIWNHLLTPAYQRELIAKYREQALAFGLDDAFLNIMSRFLKDRPAILRRQLRNTFGFGPMHGVEVRAPVGTSLRVDGHVQGDSYGGKYTEGSMLRVTVENSTSDRELFWDVDGVRHPGRELELEITGFHRVLLVEGAPISSATDSR